MISKCRYCQNEKVVMFLDYGMIPLVNNLLTSKDMINAEERSYIEEKFPLDLYFCKECGLVQIGTIVPPEKMFSNYLYFSSTSSTFVKHGFDFASNMKQKLNLNSNSFVVEIASNDGVVLKSFKEQGIPFLGVDPAENIVHAANENGIKTKCAFFNFSTANEIANEQGKADLIYGMNVFAHIPEIHDFVKGMKLLIKENGIIVIEAPYIVDFIKHNEFDTVYHEHVNYLGLHSMQKLFQQFGLDLFDAEWQDIHGGSMRYFFCHKGKFSISTNVQKYFELEEKEGLMKEETYFEFAKKAYGVKRDLLKLLDEIKSQGKNIIGYAASAKGIVLLNFCGIDKLYLNYLIDKSTHKQNYLIPGMHLEIKNPSYILEDQPDYVLLLAWNFKKEIMREQQEYLKRGGKFIIPIPTPIIEKNSGELSGDLSGELL